jgi:MinD-like ATPase involved in chromosome partitioning or flagellar assembly
LATRLGVDVIVVSESLVSAVDGWDALRALSRLAQPAPEIWAIADVGPVPDGNWAGLATRIIGGSGDQAVSYMAATRAACAATPNGACQIIVVLGAKGGVGKTFISANLGASLAMRGGPAGVFDLDFESGDLALRLGAVPQMDLVQLSSSLPADSMARCVSRAAVPDLLVWAAPAHPELASLVSESRIDEMLAGARKLVTTLVVDTPGDLDCGAVYATLEDSSHAILVTTLSPGAVRQAKVMVELLKRLNYPVRDRLKLVINRVTRRAPLLVQDACEVIGLEPVAILPEVPGTVDREAFHGCPTVFSAPRMRVSRLLMPLASLTSPGSQGAGLEVRRMWKPRLPRLRGRVGRERVSRWS